MTTIHKPAALEGYVKMLVANAAETVQQIRGGRFPSYDDNCRRDLGEGLVELARAREQQLELDPAYPVGPVEIADLQEHDLPADMTLGELRRVRRFVTLPTPSTHEAP